MLGFNLSSFRMAMRRINNTEADEGVNAKREAPLDAGRRANWTASGATDAGFFSEI